MPRLAKKVPPTTPEAPMLANDSPAVAQARAELLKIEAAAAALARKAEGVGRRLADAARTAPKVANYASVETWLAGMVFHPDCTNDCESLAATLAEAVAIAGSGAREDHELRILTCDDVAEASANPS